MRTHMKPLTIIRWCWNVVLIFAGMWLLFEYIGPPMILKGQRAFQPNGVDLMRLAGVFDGIALLIALFGILTAISSPFAGIISARQKWTLVAFTVVSLVLAACGGVLKYFEFQQSLGLLFSYRSLLGIINGQSIPSIVLLAGILALAIFRKRGVWLSLADLFCLPQRRNDQQIK